MEKPRLPLGEGCCIPLFKFKHREQGPELGIGGCPRSHSWKALWQPVCVGVAGSLFKVSFKLHQTVSGVEKKEKGEEKLSPTAFLSLPSTLLPPLQAFNCSHRLKEQRGLGKAGTL